MTMIDVSGKRLDVPKLADELTAAGVPHRHLSTVDGKLVTYDDDGWIVYDWPDEAVPVVDAHDAPLTFIEVAEARVIDTIARTTDATPAEIVRIATRPQSVYRVTLRVTGIDVGNGVTRDSEYRVVFKRPSANLAQVGTTAVLSNFQDTAAASWVVTPGVDGTDVVVSVRGAAGRTVDWLAVGSVDAYAPSGLPPVELPPSAPIVSSELVSLLSPSVPMSPEPSE
jgi:hypothetical protein